jgi:hypothetical protein
LIRIAAFLLFAGMAAAHAAASIPSSELPGRERDRFGTSPIDRFTEPGKGATPLWKNKRPVPLWKKGCRQPTHGKGRPKKKGC